MPSPYPFKENILWLLKHISPDFKNTSNLKRSFPEFEDKELVHEKSAKLLFVGDIMSMYFEKVPKCCYSAQSLFSKADFIIGNLEAPITKEEKGKGLILNFKFEFSEEYLLEFFHNFSIDPKKCVMSLANNHISDHGSESFENTIDFLHRNEVQTVGHYQGAPHPTTLRKDDLNIFLYAWTEWMNFNLLEGHNRVCRNRDILSMPKVKKKKGTVNIGIPHWGYEFRHFPTLENQKLSHDFLDLGFDFLIGHHQHVLGPFEKTGNKFCFHSLGNFLGIQLTWPTKLTGIFEVNIVSEGNHTGKIKSYTFHPYFRSKIGNEYHLLDLDNLPKNLQNRSQERLDLLYGTKALDIE
jgi:poly-gamma-glutamate capsule biosynthesis protein CapA/YwtB (metallophosphatase superfamily)